MRFRFSNLPIALMAILAVASMVKGAGRRDVATVTAERHATRCEEWRASHPASVGDPCREGGPYVKAIPLFQKGKEDIGTAKAKFAAGNIDGSAAYLDRALDTAMRLDREPSIIASLTAASLVNSVLDFVQQERATLGRERIAILLNGRKLTSAKHPMQSERLAVEQYIADMPAKLPVPTGPFGKMFAAHLINQHDAVVDNMEGRLFARDVEGCKRAATGQRTGLYPLYCEKLIDVVRAESRLELVRSSVRPSRQG